MKTLTSFLFTLVLAFGVFGQSKNPVVDQRGKKIIRASNLLGEIDGFTCKFPQIYIGYVAKRDFDGDEITIVGFVLRDAKDNRYSINLNNDQIGLLGHYSVTYISSLLEKDKQIKVWTYECNGGGSGIFIYADKIQAL